MWTEMLNILLRLGAAFLLALPLGWEREMLLSVANLLTLHLLREFQRRQPPPPRQAKR